MKRQRHRNGDGTAKQPFVDHPPASPQVRRVGSRLPHDGQLAEATSLSPPDPLSISGDDLPSHSYRQLAASRARTSRLRRGYENIERKIYKFIASALVLFVTSALVLVVVMPSPAFDAGTMSEEGADSTSSRPYLVEATEKQIETKGKGKGSTHAAPYLNQQHLRRRDNSMVPNSDQELQPRIIHVLETRFMQMQPNLVQLAEARLRLFKTICLPSILHQTAWGRFLWIIRTDPELDAGIKEKFATMLEEAGALAMKDDNGEEKALTYLIGSNDNYIVSQSTVVSPDIRPFDYLDMLSNALSDPESIFAGKVSGVQQLFDETSRRRGAADDVVMWTRLDADDGLNVNFMEYAVRYFLPARYGKDILSQLPKNYLDELKTKHQKKDGNDAPKDDVANRTLVDNVYIPPKWTYWCSGRNIEWFLTDPSKEPNNKNGKVYPVRHDNFCVTPGVTVATHRSFDPLQVPRLDHHLIFGYLKTSGGQICGRKGLSVFEREKGVESDDGTCLHMVRDGIAAMHSRTSTRTSMKGVVSKIAAVRSRTPTSAGMEGVVPDLNQVMVMKNENLTDMMWHSMKSDFFIADEDLQETIQYFSDRIYDISEDNARGQCTVGHSCKASSKDLLQQYVDLKGEMGGGFDVSNGQLIAIESK